MTEGDKSEIGTIDAPYNKQIKLEDMDLGGGMHLMRITIKEGSRFTQIDLDPGTAASWAQNMFDWANKHDE